MNHGWIRFPRSQGLKCEITISIVIRAGTPSLWTYYAHPQLENHTSDNGLLCVFWAWLSCFGFLGLPSRRNKGTQKSAGTVATRASGISSRTKCFSFALKMLGFAGSRRQAFLGSHLSNLSPRAWLGDAVPSCGESQCSQGFFLFLFFFLPLFVSSCVSTFGPWTILSYLKYPSVFSGFVTFFSQSLFWRKVFPAMLP